LIAQLFNDSYSKNSTNKKGLFGCGCGVIDKNTPGKYALDTVELLRSTNRAYKIQLGVPGQLQLNLI